MDGLKAEQPPLFCSDACAHEADFVRSARKELNRHPPSRDRILSASRHWFAFIAGKQEAPGGDMEDYLDNLFHRIESRRPLKECDNEKTWYTFGMKKILSERTRQYPADYAAAFLEGPKPGRTKGVVLWFLEDEGHGLIKQDRGGEIPVHYSGINKKGFKTLAAGERVVFDTQKGIKGPRAVNVTPISK